MPAMAHHSSPPPGERAAPIPSTFEVGRHVVRAPRAHALEDFVARYPRHPSADNALVEASTAYACIRSASCSGP